jgi:hypothetical protein
MGRKFVMSDAVPLFVYTGVTCGVWHTGLLYKLRKIGIDGNLLSWITDYLDDKKQKVVFTLLSISPK